MQKIEISKFLQILVEGENSYAYCPAGDAARIIPPVIRLYKNTGEHIDYLLFVEEYRQPLGKNIINFPGGRLNKGEDGLKAIVRELIEETGINVEVNSIKLLTASKPKDPANSAEAECLFICPQVIEINEKEGGLKSFTDKLYKNQNLDETEYCKIKLVEISNLQEFSNHNDLCLPTRLALLQLMAVKNKATNFCKSKSFYSYNKDDLNPQIVYQTKNLTAKKVDVGFDYCYYFYFCCCCLFTFKSYCWFSIHCNI